MSGDKDSSGPQLFSSVTIKNCDPGGAVVWINSVGAGGDRCLAHRVRGRAAGLKVLYGVHHRGYIMSNKSPRLDAAYLEKKGRQLKQLREQLRSTTAAAEAEESGIETETNLQAHEYEDDAQKLDMLEKTGNLVRRDLDRLARVERALKKIDEGTYGYSDISGQRIPDGRLDATPEAINTLAEQEASERSGSS